VDLSLPLADLAGDTAARLLWQLSRAPVALTGRQASALAGVAPSSGALALAELVAIGLVRRREAGRAHLYELNREHVLWAPVEAMLEGPSRVEYRIGEIVREAAGDSTTALVFGSFARREGSRSSDIDIALIWGPDAGDGVRDDLPFTLRTEIGALTGNPVQIVVLDDDVLRSMLVGHDPLLDSLRAEAVVVAGPGLSDRLRMIQA